MIVRAALVSLLIPLAVGTAYAQASNKTGRVSILSGNALGSPAVAPLFRAFVEQKALSRGVEGWVRNRRDGTVEAVFAGDPASVDAMVAACKTGPRNSRVDDIEQRDAIEDDLMALRRQAEIFSCLPTV